ncbi:MAG: helix-turn-helix domain-containing protein [Candidatus Woesearchaeota archaeon]|jgi:transcriptional regulator
MLTEKEINVLLLRQKGLTQVDVALKLKISQAAVSSFEMNSLKKIKEAQKIIQIAGKLNIKMNKSGKI